MRFLGRKNTFLKQQGKSTFYKSVGYALDGIEYAINHERNIKLEILAAIVASVMGFLLHITVIEWLILMLLIATILAFELINTAIERTVDLVTKDYHELARVSKDMAAGAVLILSCFAIIMGIVIFIPRIRELLK